MCIRICFYSLVKGLKYKSIVIAVTYDIGNDSPVAKIQNRTQVDLMNFNSFISFEFRNIGKPLFVGMLCVKLTVQTVLSNVLRVFGLSGASVVAVLNCGFYILCPANSQNPLVVDMDTVIMPQIVVDPAISLVRAFHVDLLHCFCTLFILCGSYTQLPGIPLVVSRTGNVQQCTSFFNGIVPLCVTFPDSSIKMTLSYLR